MEQYDFWMDASDGVGGDYPPAVDYVKPSKFDAFVCHCGCGMWFTSDYKTRKPMYMNKKHLKRAYRARALSRAMAWEFIETYCNGSLEWFPTAYHAFLSQCEENNFVAYVRDTETEHR